MMSKPFIISANMVLVVANSFAAQTPTALNPIPSKLEAMIKEIDKIEKPTWSKDVDMAADRGCTISFYGKPNAPHRIRLKIGLSTSDLNLDYYFSDTELIFVSKRHQVVFTYHDDGKKIQQIYRPSPNIDELRIGFTDNKVAYESRKGDYFEGAIAELAKVAQKEAKELNAISEHAKSVDLEHWNH